MKKTRKEKQNAPDRVRLRDRRLGRASTAYVFAPMAWEG